MHSCVRCTGTHTHPNKALELYFHSQQEWKLFRSATYPSIVGTHRIGLVDKQKAMRCGAVQRGRVVDAVQLDCSALCESHGNVRAAPAAPLPNAMILVY